MSGAICTGLVKSRLLEIKIELEDTSGLEAIEVADSIMHPHIGTREPEGRDIANLSRGQVTI